MSEEYEVQQVCEDGHRITDCYNSSPEKRKKFCEKCGKVTLTACPGCRVEIQGPQIDARFDPQRRTLETQVSVPSYCPNCGEPYPWTQNRIAKALQTFTEFGDLNEEEKKTIEQDIENIAKDVPGTELSAMRIKQIWDKCSRAGYAVIMEFASHTAAKILKDP